MSDNIRLEKSRNIYELWRTGDGDMAELAIGLYDLTAHYEALLDDYEKLEAKLSKMEGLEIQINDGDVWLIFPNAAISIESICQLGLPGPIVRRNIRTWRDKALAGESDE